MTLDELFLPDTPRVIKNAYYNYSEEARHKEFSLFDDDIVVLDTETTGIDFKNDELLEIAAVRMHGREIVDTFQTFVCPTKDIPERITKLTGITPADVVDAPTAKQAVLTFKKFAGTSPIVAHNMTFDRNFIAQVRGTGPVLTNWIDSLPLSRIALPALKSHSLPKMAQAFGCSQATHRALDDVLSLCAMWRIILVGLSHLPAGYLQIMLTMHEEIDWVYRPIIANVTQSVMPSTFSFVAHRRALLESEPKRFPRDDAKEKQAIQTLSFPTKEEVDEAFVEGGLVSNMYANYCVREEQVTLAQEVRSAQETSTYRGVEAGTGVGKTLGYLLPSTLFAKRNDITIGVATKTNALLDQIISKELPLLNSVFPDGVKYTYLKGFDHYPCLKRIKQAFSQESFDIVDSFATSRKTVETDLINALAIVGAYACESLTGDIDKLGVHSRNVPSSLFTCSSSECSKSKCPFYNVCFVYAARRNASTCDVVVTNHSLLLSSIKTEGKILPPINHWIIDEAHSFETEARQQWAFEVNLKAIKSLLDSITGTKTMRSSLDKLTKLAKGASNETLIFGQVSKSKSIARRLQDSFISFEENLATFTEKLKSQVSGRPSSLWVSQKERESDAWQELCEEASELFFQIDDLLKTQQSLKSNLEDGVGVLGDTTVDILVNSLMQIREAFNQIFIVASNEYVYSVSIEWEKGYTNRIVRAEYINIGKELEQLWLHELMSVVFTSATIEVGKSFSYFNKQVGLSRLEPSEYRNLRLKSSFDYQNNMRSLVVRDLPNQNTDAYKQQLADVLYDTHIAMEGSVLTLFTNRMVMEDIFALVEPRLKKAGYSLYMQERSNARRAREDFFAKKENSLFALKSFWEGFDAQGDTLRCVVVVKLPFSNPNEPILLEREDRKENVWKDYYVPDAVVTLKQAAGRLLRSETDSGVLLLLDSRLESKGYGRTFKYSLPVYPDSISKEQVAEEITSWRKRHDEI